MDYGTIAAASNFGFTSRRVCFAYFMHVIVNQSIVVTTTVGNAMHTSAPYQNISITWYMDRRHVRTETKA